MQEYSDWWWGYKHTNGSLQAKRWLSEEDIPEAKESPFVERVTGPFRASGRDEALSIIKEEIGS